MKKNVMESAFDGDWFLRAYDANGEKMGSKECEEGKIFIEPQGFAVMSEIGKDEGADIKTLNSIDKYLNTKYGLVLNNPAFTKYYIQYGEILHTPADTRRTQVSSHTTMLGSSALRLTLAEATRHSSTTARSLLLSMRRSPSFTRQSLMYTVR